MRSSRAGTPRAAAPSGRSDRGAHTPRVPSSRDLFAFLGSRFAGTLGVQTQRVALGWQIYERTGDILGLACVGLAQSAPIALRPLPAGNFAARVDRKRILMLARGLFGVGSLGLAGLSFAPGLGVVPIYAVLVLLGATRAFAAPASWALLPALVEP